MYGEGCFDQKYIYTWAKHRFTTTNFSQKDSQQSERIDSLVKKKIQTQGSVKKVVLIVFWNMKGPINIDFLEKEV